MDRLNSQSGNIFFTLFGAVGLVGILGAASMTILKGPVRSMHNVTQRTIAENNMIASGKLALMAATNQADDGDCDADTAVEPIPFSTTGTGPFPIGGGYLPDSVGAAKQDPWGNTYGYCAWDHGTIIKNGTCAGDDGRLRGNAAQDGIVLAVISSGADRVFQTACGDDPDYIVRTEGSDDIVLAYTYDEAGAMSGGLWNIKESDPETAEIAKNLEVKDSGGNTTFSLDSFTGIGDFLGIVTGSIAAKTATQPVELSGGLKMDNEANVTECSTATHAGTIRYHSANGLEVCDGVNWLPAGGSVIPSGTIAAFAANECPDGWSEYTPARGHFLRGRDPTGANDPDGARNAGSLQGDANKSHGHAGTAASAGNHAHSVDPPAANTNSAGSHSHTMDNVGNNASDVKTDNAGGSPSVRYNYNGTTNAAGAHTHSVNIPAFNSGSAGAHTHSLTINADGGPEARPKNVAVTFCQYNGGVSNSVDELNDLGDVVLSAPQVGQVLTFDGINWVNQNSASYWSQSGSSLSYITGNVGIGTIEPLSKLHVRGPDNDGTSAALRIETPDGSQVMLIDGNEIDSVGSGNGHLYLQNNSPQNVILAVGGGNVGIGITPPAAKLDVAGDVLISGNATSTGFYYSSDARLKENIETLTPKAVDDVYRLRGVSFDWKKDGRQDIGLIAQEVEEHFPELVAANDNGMKSVKYGNLVALLLEALKHQQGEIDTLRDRMDEMEGAK